MTTCSGLYPLIIAGSPNECVASCSLSLPFIQNYYCVADCTGSFAKPESGNVCSNTCKYYTNTTGYKICIANCIGLYPYYLNTTLPQCVSVCPTISPD